MDKIVKQFQLDYPELCSQMHNSTHHYSLDDVNPYHIEGSCWSHVMMVCLVAKQMKLSRLLNYVALLHDIGKPECRQANHEKKRVHFFGHEPYSAFLALEILKKYGFSSAEISHAFQLICLHTETYKLSKEELEARLIGQPELASDLLKIRTCDTMGRFYDHPDEVLSDFAPGEKQKRETTNKAIFLVGLPGSGKTTYRNELLASGKYMVVSFDDLVENLIPGETYSEKFKLVDKYERQIKKEMAYKFKTAKENKLDLIIEKTNLNRKSRKPWSDVPECYSKEAVVFLTDMSEIWRRNEARKEVGKFIDPRAIKRMMTGFYPPMLDEFDCVNWRV